MQIGLMVSVFLLATAAWGASTLVSVKVSGPGVVNDSTLKANEKVSVDIYFDNDTIWKGFSLGFKLVSMDIKHVVHVVDSGKGVNERGDIKAFNGWQDNSVWDFGGLYVVERDWDGKLPDLLGFGGVSVKRHFGPTKESQKNLSFDIIISEPGTLVVDSAFYPPGGKWMFSLPSYTPKWAGPYRFKVVK
jgi:hypothetical protein